MKVEIWVPGQPLGHFSAEEMSAIRGESTGPIVAVIDETGGAAIVQPIDPQTGLDWTTEEDAIAFAERYISSSVSNEPPVDTDVIDVG